MTLKSHDELDKKPVPPRGSDEWVANRTRYVYVIAHPHGYFKIGTSKDPESRLGDLQVGSPYELRVLVKAEFDEADAVESRLHELLDEDNVSGEWFELSRSKQDQLINWITENGSLFDLPESPEDSDINDIKEKTLREAAFL